VAPQGQLDLAVTWFEHRRTRELCDALDLEVALIDTRRRGIARYLELTWRTLQLLRARRPRTLLVQNPSLILALLVVMLRGWFGFRLIVDAHNEAVEPFINRGRLVRWITRFVLRKADVTIVSNRQLAQMVRAAGGRPFVLPDRVPTVAAPAQRHLPGAFRLVFICTYAPDEPVAEVVEAVRGLDVTLFVTGRLRNCDPRVRAGAPANVSFTDFLSEESYWEYLAAADAIIDLTLMPNCLVCGSYEAAALGKPLLLSRNDAAVDLFGDGALYTTNDVTDLRRAISRLREDAAPLATRMRARRDQLRADWERSIANLADEFAAGAPARNVVKTGATSS
jgi:glycosyltransferase involved in cell wall biosynthesis